MSDEPPLAPDPITFCDLPVRVDPTLVDPDEIWLESDSGDVVRVWPPTDANEG